ncbi:hypothetical protein [Acinetobacter nematophilus]|uniref:Uncharacterized protein n=1 Tax=Acinetobacter nematophilus TaxID=2994642 RepID=A0A9X3IFQ6_9GAMM|nr:hypothetical protein [Acinetobacter nematophilus]MCX5466882.1 hypothetical protein [Acinetobacter nematophilus]
MKVIIIYIYKNHLFCFKNYSDNFLISKFELRKLKVFKLLGSSKPIASIPAHWVQFLSCLLGSEQQKKFLIRAGLFSKLPMWH